MTQKQGLINLTESLPRDFRLLLVSNWLEDINWHGENAILWTKIQYRNPELMKWLASNRALINPGRYDARWVMEQNKNATPRQLAEVQEILINGSSCTNEGGFVNQSILHDYKRAESHFSPFAYIYGFGISNDGGWDSEGTGEDFVNELISIIEA